MAQKVEGYATVGGQLTAGDRDHASRPHAQKMIPARVQRRTFPPRQDTKSCESGDHTLLEKHLLDEKLVRQSQEMGDIRGPSGHARGISFVLLVGGAQEDRVLVRYGVEVVATLQSDGDGCPPSFVGLEYHVDAFAQAGNRPAAGIYHQPDLINPRTGSIDDRPAPYDE